MAAISFQNVEVLVHNVSHSDLVLTLKSSLATVVARPKFSQFREITSKILAVIERSAESIKISQLPTHYRHATTDHPVQYEVIPSANGVSVPVGFDLSQNSVGIDDINNLRFRRDDKTFLDTEATIDAAYFPLLGILIPKWIETTQMKSRSDTKFVVIFVTGRGTPYDSSSQTMDNSTYATGVLMTRFMNMLHPNIEVVHIHSSTNLFRYDENIVFVRNELLPTIDAIRDELVDRLPPDTRWKDRFQVTLSFADGSSARVSAINASLKHYRFAAAAITPYHRLDSSLVLCNCTGRTTCTSGS